ncbi:MAG: hypothetical protein HKL80_03190 [Acidimicrobiales bacterium]|nr:hypothetical protein [Acidimicrobiales bacterium]
MKQRKIMILAACLLLAMGTLALFDLIPNKTKVVSSKSTTPTTRSSTTAPVISPVKAQFPEKDLSIFPEFLSRAEVVSLLNLAISAGVQIISTDANWSYLEPNLGQFKWQNLDELVSLVTARGLQVKIQIIGFPDWARDQGKPTESVEPWLLPESTPELLKWSQFVTTLTTRYSTKVSFYEIWNEPNIESFAQPFPDPAIYARLLETSYMAIRSVNQSSQVMFAGLSRNDIGYLTSTYQYINQEFPATASSDHHFFDILGVHPYCANRSPEVNSPQYDYQDSFGTMNENFLGMVEMHDVMAANGEGSKLEYISEFGYTTVAGQGFPTVSEQTRALYLTQSFEVARQLKYVVALSWYAYEPTPYVVPGWSIVSSNGSGWSTTPTFESLAAFH